MADDDGGDVGDFVTEGGEGCVEFLFGGVVVSRKNVVDGSSPDF